MTVETITGKHNALLTHLRKLASSRAYRYECGEYLGDGTKLLFEALKWGAPLVTVVVSEDVPVPELPEGVRAVRLGRELMRSVSPAETPQGALFTARIDREPLPERLDGRRYLVLDGVQDPGNVGTILRTADAFDCEGVFLVNACADRFNPKTVRATMGAVFRVRAWSCTVPELAGLLRRSGIPLYGAALRGDTVPLSGVDLSRAAVAIGSEGRGLGAELLSACEGTIRIPMSARCESLNAATAAGVVLWEMYRNNG